jgi:hypothetical protein
MTAITRTVRQPSGANPTAPSNADDATAWEQAKQTRRYSPLASTAAATAVGMLGGVAVASVLSVALRGRLNGSYLGRAALAGAGFGALGLAANVATGGSVGNSLLLLTHGQRHQIGFAVSHLHHPWLATDARAAYRDARELQAARYGEASQIDNGADALRHGYGAARLASTFVQERGMDVPDAQRAVEEIGRAHELDGIDNTDLSAQMDEFNNRVGAELGSALAVELQRAPTREELATVVTDAIGRGELRVIDDGALRPARASDLPESAG